MFEIIPGKKKIGAQIICDLKSIKKNHTKKIKYAIQYLRVSTLVQGKEDKT